MWQTSSKHRWQHGGILRKKRAGRSARPLSTKDTLHLVFKMDRETVGFGFRHAKAFLHVKRTIDKYAKRFFIKIDQLSIQGDHIHLQIRAYRRAQYQHFFRVVAGQIAQGLLKPPQRNVGGSSRSKKHVTGTPTIPQAKRDQRVTGIPNEPETKTRFWLHRPYTRVVRGWRAYKTVRDYIFLNEAEVTGVIPYRKDRLKGLSEEDRAFLLVASRGQESPLARRPS